VKCEVIMLMLSVSVFFLNIDGQEKSVVREG
jgi:hypothetical protein